MSKNILLVSALCSALPVVGGPEIAAAQKFPSCTSGEAQARTKTAVTNWVRSTMERATQGDRSAKLLAVNISIPYRENAYVGPYAGVLKCSIDGYAVIRRWDYRVARLQLQRIMVYYTYDQNGNLIVEACRSVSSDSQRIPAGDCLAIYPIAPDGRDGHL